MKSLNHFLNQLREQSQQLEQFVATMSREQRLEATPVCVELAISMMCRGR
jgi:hypothetical protein